MLMGLPGQLTELKDPAGIGLTAGDDAHVLLASGLTVVSSGMKLVCVLSQGDSVAGAELCKLLADPLLASHQRSTELVGAGVTHAQRAAFGIVMLREELLRATALGLLTEPTKDIMNYMMRCMAAWMRLRLASVTSLRAIERLKSVNFRCPLCS